MADPKEFTILVVDDEPMLRENIVDLLRDEGFKVLEADNGANGFKVVKENKIDLVVSDMRMPGGDGLSLLEAIRAHNPSLPVVIFITGFSDFSEEHCIKKGARKVLSKPFESEELIRSVYEGLKLNPVKSK